MDEPERSSEYLEDIPPLWVEWAASRAILNAQTKAKITDGTYQPRRFVCRFRPRASLSKLLAQDSLKLRNDK